MTEALRAVRSAPIPTEPVSTGTFEMDTLTLRFRGDVERQFRAARLTEVLPQIRAGLVLGFVLYAVFGLLDLWVAPEQLYQVWFVRYAIACPTMAACFAATFSRRFTRFLETALVTTMAVAVAGIIAMTALIPPPGSYLYYAGLLLTVIAYCTLVRLRFVSAALLAVAELAAYITVDRLLVLTPTAVFLNNLFFLTSASILALSASYALEKHARWSYAQARMLAARTRDLEEANADLARKNVELAKSKEEIARSARRTELVFSALTEALPGTLLDERYRLEERIGSGTFGTVYRATHLALDEPVAVKVFRPRATRDGLDSLERVRVEGISAFRVRHPNAVIALDFGVTPESIAYLVMELLRGHSLAEEIRSLGLIPPRRCAEIMAPVCAVLAASHAQGVVHRDIKPSNIFLHRDGRGEVVKVIDFGIAKVLGEDPRETRTPDTATGFLVGTPVYVAPERFDGRPYDGAVDVFAVGVTLYEMLAGRLPFEAHRDDWMYALMRGTDPGPLPRHDPSLSETMEAAVMTALARDPAVRPSAESLYRVLADAAGIGVSYETPHSESARAASSGA